jgi:hypothetical protein
LLLGNGQFSEVLIEFDILAHVDILIVRHFAVQCRS